LTVAKSRDFRGKKEKAIMITYVENPKDSTKKHLELTVPFKIIPK